MIRASKEVSDRKAVTQTGFKKLNLPQFNGDILNYQEFKTRWRIEVVPERRPPALELATLRESLPTPAKAKIIAVTTMAEAWKLLDLDYGDIEEVRAKLKREIRSFKIKATSSPAKIVEIFQQIQLVAAKIKATGNNTLLEDQEYVALVGNHLPEETMWKWLESEKSGWTDFYNFLEDSAAVAKRMLTSKSINAALSGEGDKSKCSSCNKPHTGKCNKIKNAAVVQGATKTCPVCNKPAHKYKTRSGTEAVSKRVKDCLGFKTASDDQKREIIKKLKAKNPVCPKCSSTEEKIAIGKEIVQDAMMFTLMICVH